MREQSPRVLIVDDEPGVRMTLAANLELEGFEVLEADGGAEALELVRTQSFDVLLTDIRMPGMNGIELMKELKKSNPHLVTIVMTAFALEQLIEDGISEGAYTVLRKPFNVELLAKVIARAAKRGAVLLVDDQPEVTSTLSAALQSAGVPTLEAEGGPAALSRLEAGNIDACVVDLVMPEMDGTDVCRKIQESGHQVIVLAMTGQDVPELIKGAVSAGSYACLRKPFSIQSLLRTLTGARREVLNRDEKREYI